MPKTELALLMVYACCTQAFMPPSALRPVLMIPGKAGKAAASWRSQRISTGSRLSSLQMAGMEDYDVYGNRVDGSGRVVMGELLQVDETAETFEVRGSGAWDGKRPAGEGWCVGRDTVCGKQPQIIQGGMGVQVSSWRLARELARAGELGIVSGTAMDVVVIRWLNDGDPGNLYRNALAHFPDQGMAQRFIKKYYIPGGKKGDQPYQGLPMWTLDAGQALREACVIGNFCEIWLAKHEDDGSLVRGPDGQEGRVGVNCLTKIQIPTIDSLYGAMLAGTDYVIMGAGIPMEVPGILDRLAEQEATQLVIDVDGSEETHHMKFDPLAFWTTSGAPEMVKVKLKRPNFFPIVSSVMLAQAMLKRASGDGPTKGIQGFVIEFPTAGGHNAPPRGYKYDADKKSSVGTMNERGEPVYGAKDEVDLAKFKKAVKGLPFYLAGFYGRPDKLQDVLAIGGAGIQVGTAFAFSKESGLSAPHKEAVLKKIASGDLSVYTDPVASPTGFPFKVLEIDETLSNPTKYAERPRICNLGYLRTPFLTDKGKIGYRCASEPVKDWVKKGGAIEAAEGRKCLCNGLMSDAGMPQISPFKKEGETKRYVEEPMMTAGDDVNICRKFMKEQDIAQGKFEFSAKTVIEFLLGRFKEEYSAEARLYEHASDAEDPDVRERLMTKAKTLEQKIENVKRQLGDVAITAGKTDEDEDTEAAKNFFARFDTAFDSSKK